MRSDRITSWTARYCGNSDTADTDLLVSTDSKYSIKANVAYSILVTASWLHNSGCCTIFRTAASMALAISTGPARHAISSAPAT